jgi:hypothetical protein
MEAKSITVTKTKEEIEAESAIATKTKEEIEAESAIATQEGLVELGRILHEKEAKKRNFDNIYQKLLKHQKEMNDINNFNIELIDKHFNLDVYVQQSLKKYKKEKYFYKLDSLTNESKDNFYTDTLKFNILNEMTTKLLLDQEKDTENAIQISNETSEQTDEYLEEIEKLEEDKKKSDEILAKRIINLREKCIHKNKLLFWHRILIGILSYTSLMSLSKTLNQTIFCLNTVFIVFKFIIDYTLFSCWYSYRILVDFDIFPILVGCFFGIIGVYYYNLKNKKNIIKE